MNASSPWAIPSGHWSLEEAISYLAFGDPKQPLVPAPSAAIAQDQWLKIRFERDNQSLNWVRALENALNMQNMKAFGSELPSGIWSNHNLPNTGVALEDRAAIERTVRSKSKKSRFRLTIDPTFRYIGAGIALVLEDDNAGLMNMVKVYVMVDVQEAQVKQLKRQIEHKRGQMIDGPDKKRKVGRPNITSKVMEIYCGREKDGLTQDKAIEEAKICCEIYKKRNPADDVKAETLARKIAKYRQENRMPA